MKKIFCCPALELFHCLLPLFHCLPLWTTVRLHGKKLQNATNSFMGTSVNELTAYGMTFLQFAVGTTQ